MNYLRLIKGNILDLFFNYYMYVDTQEPESPAILAKHNIKVKFKGVYIKENEKYILVAVRISKRKDIPFFESMAALANTMLIKGHTDYIEESERLISYLKELDRGI